MQSHFSNNLKINVFISVRSINPRSTPFGTSSNVDSCVVIGEQRLNNKNASSSFFSLGHSCLVSLLALTAGRGDARNEVGLAAVDLQYPYLILCQISDCQTYVNTLTKINILDPTEVSVLIETF